MRVLRRLRAFREKKESYLPLNSVPPLRNEPPRLHSTPHPREHVDQPEQRRLAARLSPRDDGSHLRLGITPRGRLEFLSAIKFLARDKRGRFVLRPGYARNAAKPWIHDVFGEIAHNEENPLYSKNFTTYDEEAVEWNIGQCGCAHFAANLARGHRVISSLKWRRPEKSSRHRMRRDPAGGEFRAPGSEQNVVGLKGEIFCVPEVLSPSGML